MKRYFSIGELAGYQNISKQTLIYYDKIGLFCPHYVDPNNGYRYYSENQLDILDTILIMKNLGFSLEDIKRHLEDYNLDNSRSLMKNQLRVIEDKIRELNLIKGRILHKCRWLDYVKNIKDKEAVTVEKFDPQYIFCMPVKPPYSYTNISIATKACFTEAAHRGLPVFFQSGVIVPLEHIKSERYTEAVTAFLSMAETEQTDNIILLKAGRCVSTYHLGDYDLIGTAYRRILDYCAKEGLDIISDSYEFCINDYITSKNTDEYITKICFYVR